MTKWEYWAEVFNNKPNDPINLPSFLKEKGEQGWELINWTQTLGVGGSQLTFIFKKKLIK